MCGRFALTSNAAIISRNFSTDISHSFKARFNIAPSQKVLVIRVRPHRTEREAVFLKWGLIPSWAREPTIGALLVNARAETAAIKPSFKTSFRQQRCLIPADGFYEWGNNAGIKQAYYIQLRSREPFGFGGLWETWGQGRERIETCTILTCHANSLMQPIHQRMPVVIQPNRFDSWLHSDQTRMTEISKDLHTLSAANTVIRPVSEYVNDVRHDDTRCQTPCEHIKQPNLPRDNPPFAASQKFLFNR